MLNNHEVHNTQMSDVEAGLIADRMADRLIARLSDEDTVNMIIGVWTKQFDAHIGRTFRRGVWIFLTAVALFVAIRFEDLVHWLTKR